VTDGPLVWYRRLPVDARVRLVAQPHGRIPPDLVDTVVAAGAPFVRATVGDLASPAMFLTPEYQNFLHATKLHLAWEAAATSGDVGEVARCRTTYDTFVLANDESGDTSPVLTDRAEQGMDR
jgi:hypothetical protein